MKTVVALPARDEAERIVPCLQALVTEAMAAPDDILLLVNNSTDDTAAIARAFAAQWQSTRLHVVERIFPPEQANAGQARRTAMDLAARLAGSGGVLLTTDADGRVDRDWLAANLAALQLGADLVCGWVELEPAEWAAIPIALHEDDARECEYDGLCDRIHDLLDPDPYDPWPRHTQEAGASLAMTAAAYLRCGGVPEVASGEDRALVQAMRRVDGRIRHAPEVHVFVSGRLQGRAASGMADTISRRMIKPDSHLDDRLEPAAVSIRRAEARRLARLAHRSRAAATTHALSRLLHLSDEAVLQHLSQPSFGESWFRMEQASPALARCRVPVAELSGQVAAARAFLAGQDAGSGEPDALAAAAPQAAW